MAKKKSEKNTVVLVDKPADLGKDDEDGRFVVPTSIESRGLYSNLEGRAKTAVEVAQEQVDNVYGRVDEEDEEDDEGDDTIQADEAEELHQALNLPKLKPTLPKKGETDRILVLYDLGPLGQLQRRVSAAYKGLDGVLILLGDKIDADNLYEPPKAFFNMAIKVNEGKAVAFRNVLHIDTVEFKPLGMLFQVFMTAEGLGAKLPQQEGGADEQGWKVDGNVVSL